ncbi:MarR family winged helix-turn-helix transcriptional regulator [Aureimonas jatrophae]|uniref:DNA-binding transcriptional regulator, MarR family n=1 Tax=Aureimonas jatrophae TaxID=1166073 RepID=A0A1H0J651_9HYPH|nr:MarR family transcriptional regulator [Aureimonas jatrophae]MBB3951574.1 DNA-binding MarR family transcriptional regulator [Aureimonas jatrophae]SDO39215.1 DNA-binding transcriptional regulator, MarR family [Aureimonas jatrophae]
MDGAKRKKQGALGQLMVSSRLVRTALSTKLAAHGLYSGQDAVLLAIAEDLVPLRELAERLQVKPPTVTKTVARLSAQGILAREQLTGETRQGAVRLTERGLALLSEIRHAQKETEREAFADLSGKQRRTLRKLLRRVERSLAARGTQAPAVED